MRKQFYAVGLFAIVMFVGIFQFCAAAGEEFSFKEIKEEIEQIGEKYGTENVVVTFDLDCTLLTASDNFGSDIWYDWQSDLFSNDKNSPNLVSKNFDQLLNYQNILGQLSKMYPTEACIPGAVKELQKKGYATIVLTARGYDWRPVTERVLKNNDLIFETNNICEGFPGQYIPYETDSPQKYGLTGNDVDKLDLKKARPVSFFNGIYMVAGQNKGVMLRNLLFKAKKSFKVVILVDDSVKNTTQFTAAFEGVDGVKAFSYRYAFDDSLKRFYKLSNKNNCIRKWEVFKKADAEMFGN